MDNALAVSDRIVCADRVCAAYEKVRRALVDACRDQGYWEGELAPSALATATAIGALCVADDPAHRLGDEQLIHAGVTWLIGTQLADGGWGDTPRSKSNISTTFLARAALLLASRRQPGLADRVQCALDKATAYMDRECGAGSIRQAEAIEARYGQDRTFSVPILMMAALAGIVEWESVPALPFELAVLPQRLYRFLRMPVVSYALPALIAIGQAAHAHRRTIGRTMRWVRDRARKRTLAVLTRIQPESGGFLEATPLTSFVVMALVSAGQTAHPVVHRGLSFLRWSVRPDGSWPIDSNLSVWLTTQSVQALAAADDLSSLPDPGHLVHWILERQYKTSHPYTGAEPGGWSWTHLSGGVPDADDTASALLALRSLGDWLTAHAAGAGLVEVMDAAWRGTCWLYRLQNRDGGWPTFCRGWGRLPFDRSGTDLTAHVLGALAAWRPQWQAQGVPGLCRTEWFPRWMPGVQRWWLRQVDRQLGGAIRHGLAFLGRMQHADGAWSPLWFGNECARQEANWTYGTARVLAAYHRLGMMDCDAARRGADWLMRAQNADGSWGGDVGLPGTIEETALATEALARIAAPEQTMNTQDTCQLAAKAWQAVHKGLDWLCSAVLEQPLAAPIGLYFARLWYYEKLYPLIFATAALGRVRRILTSER